MVSLVDYELQRTGIGRVPAPGGGQGDSAIQFVPAGKGRPMRSCTCKESRRKTCRHLRELSKAVAELASRYGAAGFQPAFEASLWYRLGHLLQDSTPVACSELKVAQVEGSGGLVLRFASPKGVELARYLDRGPAHVRLLERTGKVREGDRFVDRAGLLERLALFQLSPEERKLSQYGMKTRRQSWEESFWYRLAYHCVREVGLEAGRFRPSIDAASGDFRLLFSVPAETSGGEERPFVSLTLPRSRVPAVLKLLREAFPGQEDLAIHPVPLQSIFRVTGETELDLEVRAEIRALQESGEELFFARDELERFRYGRLVYLPELGILAELEKPGQERRFRAPARMRLARSQVPSFLDEHREALDEGTLVLDEPLGRLAVRHRFDYLELAGEALERSWYYLSAEYGFGASRVSLREVLDARAEGLPYLETEDGWIDLRAPAFRALEGLAEHRGEADEGEGLRLSAGEVLRLSAAAGDRVRVAGEQGRRAILERLLKLEPAAPFEPPEGLTSRLRPYQRLGVDWLRFLFENRLGGLLCDDMGLGKTHQAMALMVCLREQEGIEAPMLVVCPTSVLSHWRDKIRDFAPGLRAVVHHGLERDLEAGLGEGDVVITSFGVLRRDLEALSEVPFVLAVFDEIQHLKNRETLGYRAAASLGAEVKLGLTGTPIENSLSELKALFDLVLPGYLGHDEVFEARYGAVGEEAAEGEWRLEELRRQVAPFMLRRLKASVLDELPEKIEDVRTCALSDDQLTLYREAIADRGSALVERLHTEGEPLPYIHVFALLNLLKQICDHPALALGKLEEAASYASGKWDLYREILSESLDSGQKVVVFSQYLGMIRLMEEHLRAEGVGCAVLTGASRRRGEIVDRFNQDPDCRVFLGSLKAGGTGIDLVGGSVVIHYDRWWNAAREDQASDRVHRIGQKRAVQVFKLITEGTLEEKIAAIIDKKRRLMESVVQEDDPKLSKIFSREELLDLLRPV